MPISVFDLLSAENIKEWYNSLQSTSTIYSELFPLKKQIGIDLMMVKGAKNRPVALKPSAFDVPAPIRPLNAEISEERKQIPFFKESILIDERTRQELLRAQATGIESYYAPLITKVFENIQNLIDGADVQRDRMCAQIMTTGKVYIQTTNALLNYDYGLPAANKETLLTTARWSDLDNSDPIGDILRWQRLFTDAGKAKPTRAACSSKTFGYLVMNKNIQKAFAPQNPYYLMSDAEVKAYIKTKTGLSIAIVTGNYDDEAGNTQSYFPDEVFTLLPVGSLGNSNYGTTPEEADLMSGAGTKVKTTLIKSVIAVTTMKKDDPVNVQTKVSQLLLPDCPRVEEMFIATVHTA